MRRRAATSGFTLLEVLVALLVLSIGLLGLAGLQLRALQYSHSGYQRTLVNLQAQDLIERMWTHLRNPRAEWEEWQAAHQASLPEWSGSLIDAPGGEPGAYELTIAWRDARFVGSAERHSLSYRVRLPVLD